MSYHWVITVQVPAGTGHALATMSGATPEVPQGVTRQEIYDDIVQAIGEKVNYSNPNVVFFALEPNEL